MFVDPSLFASCRGDANSFQVYHIHGRIGTTQSSQCPERTNPAVEEEKSFFEEIWLRVIKARFQESGNDALITFVPEYG